MKYRIYNNTLNPAVWNEDETIKPEVSQMILEVAKNFYKDTELTPPIRDILMLGSSANYNWTKTSDIDIHVSIDFSELKMPVDDAKNYTNALKSAWNSLHDIHIKKHNVELYIQNIDHKTHALGIYSLIQNKWIIKPNKQLIKLDNDLIQQKYSDLKTKIDIAIKSKDIETIKSVLKDIYDMRQAGLDAFGEFSTENIVFKLLRINDYIQKLKATISKIYDLKHSIK
jgi:hypothetical protein